MPIIPDLVRDSKLETAFRSNHTVHFHEEPDPGDKRRRIRRELQWSRKARLGHGSGGEVFLEQLVGAGEAADTKESRKVQRAVKRIRRPQAGNKTHVDYGRELVAIAKFSHKNVSESALNIPGILVAADASIVPLVVCRILRMV
jgi:hypothetical protein